MRTRLTFLTFLAMISPLGCDTTNQGASPVGGFLFGGRTGTRRVLPTNDYDAAFAAARAAMGHYYQIASVDQAEGLIQAEPKVAEGGATGLLGRTATRQLAQLKLSQGSEGLIADVSVVRQRQGSAVYRQMQTEQDNYDSVPNASPAEIDAATTTTQNENWETYQTDREMETKILNDLQQMLSAPSQAAPPPAAPPPASGSPTPASPAPAAPAAPTAPGTPVGSLTEPSYFSPLS